MIRQRNIKDLATADLTMASEAPPQAPVPSTEPQVATSAPINDPAAKIDEITAIQDSIGEQTIYDGWKHDSEIES